jgi:hypothetical protein
VTSFQLGRPPGLPTGVEMQTPDSVLGLLPRTGLRGPLRARGERATENWGEPTVPDAGH